MRAVFAALVIAFCAVQPSCAVQDPNGVSGSSGFAGASGFAGVSAPGSTVGSLPMSSAGSPAMMGTAPVAAPDASAVEACDRATIRNSSLLASRDCAACLCRLNPVATSACDQGCWELLFCALQSGCAAGDVNCIVERCSDGLGGIAALARSSMSATAVPIKECMESCWQPDEDPDADAGSETPVGGECAPLRAEPESATVGESVELIWEPGVHAGDFTLSVAPWGSVGSFQLAGGQQQFRCDAEGTATITWDSERCANAPMSLRVSCFPRSGQSCCPIDPLGDASSGKCAELGGSAPCYRGCDCLRNGGVYYTERDSAGCLQWVLRPSLDSEEHLVCLDENGTPTPDPRPAP